MLGHGFAEKISLHFTETFGPELFQLFLGFDTLGKCNRVEAGADTGDGPHDGKIAGVGLYPGNKAAIELDLVEGKARK